MEYRKLRAWAPLTGTPSLRGDGGVERLPRLGGGVTVTQIVAR